MTELGKLTKMLRLLVVIATVALFSGKTYSQSQKHCCTPDKWEASQWGVGGVNSPTWRKGETVWIVGTMSFDRQEEKFYYYANVTVGNVETSTKILEDWKTGFKYTIDLKTNTCQKTKIVIKLNDGCIPGEALFIVRAYYGLGKDAFYTKLYKEQIVAPGVYMVDYITVSDDDCVAVSEAVVGSIKNVGFAINYDYIQTTAGIKDPSVFAIPGICQKDAAIGQPMSRLETLLGLLGLDKI